MFFNDWLSRLPLPTCSLVLLELLVATRSSLLLLLVASEYYYVVPGTTPS